MSGIFSSHEAVIFGFLTAASLLVIKHFSEIRKELESKRRGAYTKLLSDLNGYLTVQSNENYLQLNQSRAETFLLASDPVARAMGEFFHAAEEVRNQEQNQKDVEPNKMLRFYAEMVLAMRKDSGEKSKLTINEVIRAMPIRYSETEQ